MKSRKPSFVNGAKLYPLTKGEEDGKVIKVNEYSLWYKKELPASHLFDASSC